MEAFRPYVARLEELLGRSMHPERDATLPKDLDEAVNGQPSAELRRQVPIDVLREAGIFFTEPATAKFASTTAGLRPTPELKVRDQRLRCRHVTVSALSDLPWVGQ
jgi:hypothetical protein